MRRILALLALLRKFDLGAGLALLKLPDFKDADETRAWFRNLVAFGDKLADMTATDFDDLAVESFGLIIEDDDAFKGFHAILAAALGALDDDEDFVVSSADARLIGEKVGIPVSAIISIVLMILQFIRAMRAMRAMLRTKTKTLY